MKKSIIAAVIAAAMAPAAQAGDITIKLGSGLKAADKEKEMKFQVGGRLMWDYENDQDADGETVNSDFEVRRARLFVKTQVNDWALKSQFNVAEESTEDATGEDARVDAGGTVEDLYIQYKGFENTKVTIGRHKAPFGLEELTSSKDISLLERGAVTEQYAVGRVAGVSVAGSAGNFGYAAGLFENEDDNTKAGDVAFVGRAYFTPIKEDDTVVHLGLGYVDATQEQSVYNVELAGTAGPFHAQAEFFEADDDGDSVDASYVQVGYILTGETRPYKGGKFKRVKPSGDNGAFEVVGRFESGFAKFGGDTSARVGGDKDFEGQGYGIGANWYVNKSVKLGVSYMEVEADGDSSVEGSEFRARAQLVF